MNSFEQRCAEQEVGLISAGELSPNAAHNLNHLFFTHSMDDVEVDLLIASLEASDRYMDGLEDSDLRETPAPPKNLAKDSK